MTVIPKNAATVILLRDQEPDGFDAFLLKRHEKSSFMGGNYVYPGRVDRNDGSVETRSLSKGMTLEEATKIFGGEVFSRERASRTGSQRFGSFLKKQECFSPMIIRGVFFK